MAKILIENNADVEAQDSGGNTPLFWAAQRGNLMFNF